MAYQVLLAVAGVVALVGLAELRLDGPGQGLNSKH